jgi:hypothetical protein
MQRIHLVLPPLEAHQPHHRELAMGIQGVWASALHASGADVFAPVRPLERDLHPFAAVAGTSGAALFHDGAPLRSRVDRIVLGELGQDGHGWRCRARMLLPEGGEVVLPRRAHDRMSGLLDVMVLTLHAIASELELDLPSTIGWRQLLRGRTVATAIEELRVHGRASLVRAGVELTAIVH